MRFVWAALMAALLLPAQDVQELAHRAQSLVDSDPAQAAQIYRQILKQRPASAEAWLYLGAALYAAGQNQESVEALQHGIKLAPKEGAAYGFMGLAEYRLKRDAAALADIERGENLGLGANHGFEAAVRQTGALILIRQSRFDDALSQLQPLGNFEDDSPGAVTAAGMCVLAIAKSPEELTPEEQPVVALAGQGEWAALRKKPEQAEAAFQEMLRRFPGGRGVHYAYGLFLMDSDQTAALAQFREAIEAQPEFWPALTVAATLETKSGNPETALDDIAKARKLAPPNLMWLCDAESGRADLALGKNDRAAAEIKSALAVHPDFPQLHHMLAQAYRRMGQRADAEKQEAEFHRLAAPSDPAALPNN